MRELFNWRWQYILYPFWRRTMPDAVRPLSDAVLDALLPTYIDKYPIQNPTQIARYWVDEKIVDADIGELTQAISDANPIIETIPLDAQPTEYTGAPVRVVAQWEPMQSVMIRFGTFYPPAWAMHARMIEHISAVARVEILVDSPLWAHAIYAYLQRRFKANFTNIRFLHLPTNDIWIRDYGAIMGRSPQGDRVAINPTYAVLPQYPQNEDNAMPERWAAQRGIPVLHLNLYTEGGNLWADTVGTLLMTSQIFYSNPYYERDTLEAYLHSVLDYEKLIITPRLTLEETGHIDLLAKLVNDDTILLSSASTPTSSGVLRRIKRQFERETNAQGIHYRILELPTPPLQINWGIHTIRRAYTNALTVNKCVLVPIYKTHEDEQALRIYEEALPGYNIIPIDSSQGIYGGGAVHCMTREVPI